MSPKVFHTVWEKVRSIRVILVYIAVVVTIIAYLTIAARYFPSAP